MVWYLNGRIKKSFLIPSSWLLGIYMISSFCGIIDLQVEKYRMPYTSEYWLPMIWFLFTLLLFLLPFRTFNENRIKMIVIPNKNTLDACSTTVIILSFFAIFFFGSAVFRIFMMGDLSYLRNSRYMGGEELVEEGLTNTIASVSASLYVFALLFFFIYSCMNGNKRRRILLLIASISEPLHVMAYVGRDGVVFWLFSFVFLYLLFRPYMPSMSTKPIKKTFIIAAVALLTPFLAITMSRFDTSNIGAQGSLISYLGQGFVNGPLYFSIEDKPIHLWGSFPLVRQIFGLREPISLGLVEFGEWKSWGFSTFLSSFVSNFGIWGMYLMALLSFAFFYILVWHKKNFLNISNIIIYILYFQIFSQGVFYFRQYTRGGNLFILLCFVFALLFKMLHETGKPIVLQRTDSR